LPGSLHCVEREIGCAVVRRLRRRPGVGTRLQEGAHVRGQFRNGSGKVDDAIVDDEP
jgi:hypothetical protein